MGSKTCSCISYNRPDLCPADGIPEVVLPEPTWSTRGRGICVDACIADAIRDLWSHEIVTYGCCCGHGAEGPSVIVDDCNVGYVLTILTLHDGREWRCIGTSEVAK